MKQSEHFRGIAVVIDDEIKQEDSLIAKIVQQIDSNGGYTVKLTALPDAERGLENLTGAAFFILDWQLNSTLVGDPTGLTHIDLPGAIAGHRDEDKIRFLKEISKYCYAPVFIFTAGDTDNITQALNNADGLYSDPRSSRIFIKKKDEVVEKGIYAVLDDWVEQNPSALVLCAWEQANQRAKNEVFADFYDKTPQWPLLLWKTFEADGMPPAIELREIIGRVIHSRMAPLDVDLQTAATEVENRIGDDPDAYRAALFNVLEGERLVRAERLPPNFTTTGDVFKFSGHFWINIRPQCDCVARGGAEVELYLLKGDKAPQAKLQAIDPTYGTFPEMHSQAAVFAMYEGSTVVFNFKTICIKGWSEFKEKRIGRLLPPFVTRIQQRYAAYLQRPGLPRIPEALVPRGIPDGR